MKRFIPILILINIAAVGGFSQKKLQQPPPPPLIYKAPKTSELKEFTAPDKSFKVTFPGTPKNQRDDFDKAMVTVNWVYRQGSTSAVSVYEFKYDLEVLEGEAFEIYKNSISKSPKIKLEAERDIKFEGRPAKEFDVSEDLKFSKIRVLISGKGLYEIKTDVTNWHILKDNFKEKVAEFEAEANRFFNSFKLLEAGKKTESVPIDFIGFFKENSYINTFFGFSFDFPEDWYNYDPSEIEERKNVGLEVLRTKQERTNRAFAEAAKKEVIIFAVSRNNYGETGGENFLVGVLKLPGAEMTAEDVALSTKNFLVTNPKIKLAEDVKNIERNGVKFSTIAVVTTVQNLEVRQKLFITVRNGYSINFALSYLNENGLKELEKIFDSLKFNLK